MTHIKQQKFFLEHQGPYCGYNTQFLSYPRLLTCQKEFLLFYMCQLSALHVVIKRQVFKIYTCSLSTKFISQMHIIAQAYLRCSGVVKTNGNHTGILLAVSVWQSSSLTRRSLAQSNYFCLLVPSHWRIASEFTMKVMGQFLTVQYAA